MGSRKVYEVFHMNDMGERIPITGEYRLRLPNRFDLPTGPDTWESWELIEIRTNVVEEATTYVLGEKVSD